MAEETRKVAFICSKGNLDMAYPALVMGWAALGNGIDVTIFFTFWGLDMITKSRVDHLEVAPVANTSMKMSMMGVKTGNLGIPNLMGVLPGMTAFATNLMEKSRPKSEISPLERLSEREREVLQRVVEGKSSAEIGKMLHLSSKTVETYRFRMMHKLGVSDLPSLVKLAIQLGLIPLT